MSSITTAVAVDYRLQQWAQLVKDCQNRPQDMTVEQWCDTKGISKSNYYYRLRCIRKACLEHVQDNSVSCQQVVEIPEKITQQSRYSSSFWCSSSSNCLPSRFLIYKYCSISSFNTSIFFKFFSFSCSKVL